MESSQKLTQTISSGKKINLFQYGAINNGVIYLVNYYENICEGLDKVTKNLEVTKFAMSYVQPGETIFSDKYLEFKKDGIEYTGEEVMSKGKDNRVTHFRILADDKSIYLLVTNYEADNSFYAVNQSNNFFQCFSVSKR